MFRMKTTTREMVIRDEDEELYFDMCCDVLLNRWYGEKFQLLEKKFKEKENTEFLSQPIKEFRKREEKEESQTKEVPIKEQSAKEGLKGFMHITCEHCGKISVFCAKERIRTSVCRECGETTNLPVEGMRRVYVNCECGEKFYYWTNSEEGSFDINCLNCGSPVAVEWNKKKGCYMTIGSETL